MSEQKKLLDTLRIDRDAPLEKVAFPVLRTTGIALLVAVVGLIAYWAGSTGSDHSDAAPASSVVATPAGTLVPAPPSPVSAAAPNDSVLSASGYITARRMATVASRITGQLTEVVVEEGMRVAAGDVLARLDDKIARNELDRAQAESRAALARVESGKAGLAEAKRVLARVENLKKTDFSSEAALTEARSLVERLTAGLESDRAEVEVAAFRVQGEREQLALHTIRAPFAGVVTEKTAQPGEVVSPMSAGGGFTRTGVCTIVDMESLEIEVDVNESYIGRVSAGQGVTANLDAYPDWEIPARAIAIIPSANREKATVRVRIGLETNDARILPDMGVKVAFKKT